MSLITKDGHKIPYEYRATAFKNSDGNQLIVSIGRDFTERKKAEEKIKQSEENYRSLFENMNEGFAYHKVIADDHNKPIDYEYIEVNPAFEKLTGLKKKTINREKSDRSNPWNRE